MKFPKILFIVLIIGVNFCSSPQVQISDAEYERVIDFCFKKLSETIKEVPERKYPKRTEGIGAWEVKEPSEWTSGFFPRLLGTLTN